ncbi:MAG: hypothetical protein EXS02_04080 [Planctomycetes bacterium]|nr:hypothetical protein [Planctomycetota bacterium]
MELPTLTSPLQLWWLALLLPLIFWLHLPPRPRQVHWTAHLPQWLLAERTVRRRPPRFRALRWLLLTLAVIAVVMAQSGPLSKSQPGPRKLLVLLDGSASMAAPGADSCFARAIEIVRKKIATLPLHIEVEVVLIGAEVTRMSGSFARALAVSYEPMGELPAPLSEFAKAASADPETAVWLLTDGQVAAGKVPGLPAGVGYQSIGQPKTNVALTVEQIEDAWPRPQLRLQIVVHNFGPRVPCHLRVSGALSAAVPDQLLDLPDMGSSEIRLDLLRSPAGGEITLRVQADGDALASDDVVLLRVSPLPVPRIAVLADDQGKVFVTAAATALAEEVGGSVVDGKSGEQVSFLLIEGGSTELTAGSEAFAAFGVRSGGASAESYAQPTGIDWERSSPLLKGLDLSDLYIQNALLAPLPLGLVLMQGLDSSGASRPLMVLCNGAHAASLHTAFRLQDSNLPLLPAFPQILRRMLVAAQGGGIAIPKPARPSLFESDLTRIPAPREVGLLPLGAPGDDLAPLCLLCAAALVALRLCLR